jgi:hypothetical protein
MSILYIGSVSMGIILFFSPWISCWGTRRDAHTKSKGHSPKLVSAFAQLQFAQLLLHYSTALFVDIRKGR